MAQPRQELTIDEIEKLRTSLKENGLERTVQIMNTAELGLARRAIREGLALLIEDRKGGVMR